jgi:hypothetical protein
MEDIRMHIIKWGKRNAFSRTFHAKGNRKAIAAWKINLGQIRRTLNMRLFTCLCAKSLTFGSQTGLTANTVTGVNKLHHDVPNAHGRKVDIDSNASNIGTPGVRPHVLNTHVSASSIHHDAGRSNLAVPKASGGPACGINATSSTHCTASENKGGSDSNDRPVGTTGTASVIEQLLITT